MTLKELQAMPPHTIFAHGITENSPDGVYMTNNRMGEKMKWIAKRGEIDDWAIYIHWADKDDEFIRTQGDKVTGKDHIIKLVPCDDEMLNRYRR